MVTNSISISITPSHISRALAVLRNPPKSHVSTISHSPSHSLRVHNIAVHLFSSLPPTTTPFPQLPLLRLSAILHDIYDHKFLPPAASQHDLLVKLLTCDIGVGDDTAQRVSWICENVSFSKQMKEGDTKEPCVELELVRDADRLEAIGAVGIARCFAYAAEKGTSFADARKHFDEKLLKLQGLMRTEPGKKLAKERHDTMLRFLEAYDRELMISGQNISTDEVTIVDEGGDTEEILH